jgi:hypothetical protein
MVDDTNSDNRGREQKANLGLNKEELDYSVMKLTSKGQT